MDADELLVRQGHHDAHRRTTALGAGREHRGQQHRPSGMLRQAADGILEERETLERGQLLAHDADAEEEHAEAQRDETRRLPSWVAPEEVERETDSDGREGVREQVERDQLHGDGPRERRAEDDGKGVAQGEHPGPDERHDHDRGRAAALRDERDDNPQQQRLPLAARQVRQGGSEASGRERLEALAGKAQPVEEEREAAEQAQQQKRGPVRRLGHELDPVEASLRTRGGLRNEGHHVPAGLVPHRHLELHGSVLGRHRRKRRDDDRTLRALRFDDGKRHDDGTAGGIAVVVREAEADGIRRSGPCRTHLRFMGGLLRGLDEAHAGRKVGGLLRRERDGQAGLKDEQQRAQQEHPGIWRNMVSSRFQREQHGDSFNLPCDRIVKNRCVHAQGQSRKMSCSTSGVLPFSAA